MKELLILCLFVLAAFAFGCDGNGGDDCSSDNCSLPCRCVSNECVCPADADADSDTDVIDDRPADGDDAVEGDVPTDQVTDGDSVAPDTVDDTMEDGDVEEEEACEQTCEENEDCDDDNVCTEDWCAPITGCCQSFTEGLNYTNCGDETFCNGLDYCLDGDCVREEACSSLPECGPCATEYCNEGLGICECTPKSEGESCDDGYWCTGQDNVCDADGNCMYAWPCPVFHENPCMQYACNEEEEECVEEAKADGENCSDDDPCNGTEFCRDGECSESLRACIDGDPCTEDLCDEDTGGCIVPAPAIEGCDYCTDPSVCDDDNICTSDYCWTIDDGDPQCEHLLMPTCIP
ncbi:MAG: hypothetical protein ABIJ56_02575 [Pseudomonadota bacterium]